MTIFVAFLDAKYPAFKPGLLYIGAFLLDVGLIKGIFGVTI